MNYDHTLVMAFQAFAGLVLRATNPPDADDFPTPSTDWYVKHLTYNGDGAGSLPSFHARVIVHGRPMQIEAWPDGVSVQVDPGLPPLLMLSLAEVSRTRGDEELRARVVARIAAHLFPPSENNREDG